MKAVLAGRPDVVGIMHTNVDVMGPALDILRRHWKGAMMAYPNSGFFRMPQWQFVDVIDPESFADEARHWRKKGVRILGGCCGLGPGHVRALAESLRG